MAFQLNLHGVQGVPSSNLGAPTNLSEHSISSSWKEAIAEAKREARAKGLTDL